MFRSCAAAFLSVAIYLHSPPAAAQNYETLFSEFDARSLSYDDKRFLQLALAFKGVYHGLLDGAWGNLSQSAMDRYARDEFGTRSEDWHMAALAFDAVKLLSDDGWNMTYLSGLDMSLLVPEKTIVADPPSENFVNFHHRNSSLAVSFGVLGADGVNNIHDYTLRKSAGLLKPYLVRKPHLAITSTSDASGASLYTRSNLVNGAWSTIIVSATKWDKNLLNAVVASITVGHGHSLSITPGGKLDHVVKRAIALGEDPAWNDESQQNVAASPPRETPGTDTEEKTGDSTGSGFFVSQDGYVVTNAHVVDDCSSITVDGLPASLVDSSGVFDLAVIKASPTKTGAFATFADKPARLNSDVTAVGFPYAGMLGGLNVTRGSVSAVKGFGNDAVQMQITAPVQSGNSGGPLLSSDGTVVGVVVQKLDAIKVASVIGDLPQNVNFAVRGEVAKLFLSQNGISPAVSNRPARLAPEDLADKAKAFTVFIECHH